GEAIQHFRNVLEIDPNHADACYRLGAVLCDEGLPQQALPFALRSVELTESGNLDALLGLTRSYISGERFNEAQATITRALVLAQAKSPNRVPEVRGWMNRIGRRSADPK